MSQHWTQRSSKVNPRKEATQIYCCLHVLPRNYVSRAPVWYFRFQQTVATIVILGFLIIYSYGIGILSEDREFLSGEQILI